MGGQQSALGEQRFLEKKEQFMAAYQTNNLYLLIFFLIKQSNILLSKNVSSSILLQ